MAACARQRGRRLCDLICSAPFWLGSFFRPWPMAPSHRQIQNHGSSRLTVASAVGGSGESWSGRESGGHETQAGQWGRESLARFPRTNRAWREYPAPQRQITVRIANENRGRVALHHQPPSQLSTIRVRIRPRVVQRRWQGGGAPRPVAEQPAWGRGKPDDGLGHTLCK